MATSSHNNVTIPQTFVIPVIVPPEDLAIFQSQSSPFYKRLDKINDLVTHGLKITDEELFSYALFYEWSDEPGWRTYKDLAAHLPDRRKRFEDYIQGLANKVVLRRSPVRDITESIGIGASLAVTARIMGVTNADFEKIDETSKTRTLDFEYTLRGTDGVEVIQVEGKGMHDTKGMSVHRKRLREKKEAARKNMTGATPVSLLGTLCDIRFEGRNDSRIYLRDPPEGGIDLDPIWYRLFLRLTYYHRELSKISGGRLTTALANRIRTLVALRKDRWTALDGVPLVGPHGEEILVRTQFATTLKLRGSKWGRQRAFGRIYDLRLTQDIRDKRGVDHRQVAEIEQRLYFRGLDSQVVAALAFQQFETILGLKYDEEVLMAADLQHTGRLLRLPSGLVSGIVRSPKWDETVLPKLVADLRGR